MHALLKNTADNPAPEINRQDLERIRIDAPALTHSLRRKLLSRHKQNFNWQEGGPDSVIKYLDRDCVEYSLSQAASNNMNEARMAKLTLYRSLAMQDMIWGGIYQYATQNWHRPHYAMTMSNQAGYMRIYALTYALWGNRLFRDAAVRIRKYLSRFLLSPVHAFYAGQTDSMDDCDPRYYYAMNENQRLHYGFPECDLRILTRENGWAIEALGCCHEFCADAGSLDLALNATAWILEHRSIADGGFRHQDQLSYLLADTLAMGRAFLQLYRCTGQPDWLGRAINAADFINLHFHHRGGGFIPEINTRTSGQSGPGIDENISLMRFSNLLSFYSGLKRHRSMARHCFRFLCLDEIATAREEETGILLADQEYNEQPLQITIFGEYDDDRA
ncbi:MAG: hypothetical protein MI673_00725, partial [Thiotrichales bacterium]|nr:hypothetical protein [Thiotrichales bacterium]